MDPFAPGVEYLLLYDGACPVCRRSVDWLLRRRGAGRLRPLPLQTPGILARFGIDEAAALRELHVVAKGGRVTAGADGVFAALGVLPRWRWVPAVMRVPGLLPAARAVYGQIASRRRRDDCTTGACARPTPPK